MLILLLLTTLTWNSEIADIEDEFCILEGRNCLMIFDNNEQLTLFYGFKMYTRAVQKDGEWEIKKFPRRTVTAAYDPQNTLSVVATPEFGPYDDSLYISYFPDVNDTTNYVILDSMRDRNAPMISNLEFMGDTAIFFYSHTVPYHDPLRYSSYLKYVWVVDTGDWNIEVLDSTSWNYGDPAYRLGYPRLRLGTGRTLYMLLSQNDENGEGFARIIKKQGDKYESDTIESTRKIHSYFTENFGLDAEGHVHILHAWDYTLFYTTNQSGSWVTETLDTLPPWASTLPCWMDVNLEGHPRGLTSQINASIDLLSKYYSYDGSMWERDTCPYTVWFEIDRHGDSHLMGLDTGRHVLPDTVFHYWLGVGIEEEPETDELTLSVESFTSPLQVFYSLPFGQSGTLILYDATGRRIERVNVTGSGSLEFSDHLSSGVYLIQLKSNGQRVTRKALILK